MTTEDMEAVMRRLEAGAPAVPAWEPRSEREAVAHWLKARGWKRGSHASPPPGVLVTLFARYAASLGWSREAMPPQRLGVALRSLGFRPFARDGRRGFLVCEPTANAMWQAAPPGLMRTARRPQRRPLTRRGPAVPPAFWPLPPRARPLVDTRGRVFPTARVAAPLVGSHHVGIQRAATRGESAGGVLWRYLTPEEVELVPRDARAGVVLPSLAWMGTAAGQFRGACQECVARSLQSVGSAPHHTPPHDSPRGGS